MARKKIVFVIVEGPSEERALAVLFNRIFEDFSVHVEVMHCDITTEMGIGPQNIVSKIGEIVKEYANHSFEAEDFIRIIHITDTDGAFITDCNVVFE